MSDVSCRCCGNSYPAGTLRCPLSGALLRRPKAPVEPVEPAEPAASTVEDPGSAGGPDPHASFLSGADDVDLALRVLPDGPTVLLSAGLPTRLGRESSPIESLCPDNVSRHHADVHVERGRVVLVDVGSVNGTYVNQGRVLPGTPQVIVEGDVVQLGTDPPFRLHVVAECG